MKRKRFVAGAWTLGLAVALLGLPVGTAEGAETDEVGAGDVDHGYWNWDYDWPFDREHIGNDDGWDAGWGVDDEYDDDRYGRYDPDYDWNTDDEWFGDWYGDADRWFGIGDDEREGLDRELGGET